MPSLSIEVNSNYSKARFKVGDEVLITSRKNLVQGGSIEGVVLEVVLVGKLRGDSIDEWLYQVQYNPVEGRSIGNHKHVNYFNESELDFTLQRKREEKLKELGI